jgi:hypothetical protein
MADLKISQLTGASTPLAGTEVLPIVQSGSTVKVSVANLTAGRAVASAGGTFSDNFVQGTAAKGINFTANTPAAGMTSQLLNWYEEGTFTPVVQGSSTAGTATYTAQVGRYTRIGNRTMFNLTVIYSGHTGTGNIYITGFPFTSADIVNADSPASVYIDGISLTAVNAVQALFFRDTKIISLQQYPVGGGAASGVPMDAAGEIRISGQYQV